MANLIRSAKFGSDWTQNDLEAYRIRVVFQDAATFFETPNLPTPSVDNEVLNVQDPGDANSDDVYALLRTLDLAMAPHPNEESAVDDFAVLLFRALRYTRRGRVARTRKDIRLFICGEERHAKTDVCIMTDAEILLLVQEEKRHLDESDPEPQLIAEAIAAFDANNRTRVRALRVAPLESKVMAGITMQGTMPTFYKIPVTSALVRSIQFGQYPAVETVVYAHIPEVARPTRRYSDGMKPLDNRSRILACYEAFRRYL